MSFWKNLEQTENVECIAKIIDLRFVKGEDSGHELAKWSIENNKLNPKTKIVEIETDKGLFVLMYKAQQEKFRDLYMNKSEVYLKVNGKGFTELALTETEVEVVKKNISTSKKNSVV